MLVATQGGGYYKGFTLIELLAIIVILAVIAVITVPIILGIIDNSSKGAAVNSAYGFRDAVQNYYAYKSLQDPQSELPNGIITILSLPSDFSASGELPSDGWVNLANGNVTEFSLKFGDYVVTKLGDEDVISEKSDYVVYNIPEEYQRVQYLQSSNPQYIDTGVLFNQDSSIQITEVRNSDQTNSSIGVNPLIAITNTGSKKRIRYNSQTYDFGSQALKNTIYLKKNNLYIDGINVKEFNTGEFSSSYSVILFGRRADDTAQREEVFNGKIYDVKMWDNDVLVRNFLPVVRKSDNKPGMLDMANLSKNLFDENYEDISANLVYKPIYVGDGTFTLSTDIPNSSNKHLFLIGGNVNSGASSGTNGVSITISRTVEAIDGYVTIVYRSSDYTSDPRDCHTMLNKGSTALPYEPYKKSFYTNEGTGEFTAGPEL